MSRTKPDPTRRLRLWDAVVEGLVLLIEPTGTKTFVLYYRRHGKPRWYRLGNAHRLGLRAARDAARKLNARIELEGVDPQAERREARAALSFGELAEHYFADAASRHRSVAQYRGHYERHLKPSLGQRPVTELRSADFVNVKQRLVRADKHGTVGPVLAVASAILKHGLNEWGVELDRNPVQGITVPRRPNDGAERYGRRRPGRALDRHELAALWPALERVDRRSAAILRTMLFTGQRGDEVKNLRWSDLDGEWWTQPTNKEDRVHRVWLSPTVRAELDGWSAADGPYVFGGPRPAASVHTQTLRRLEQLCGVRFAPHDLRHTAVTQMSAAGVDERTVSKVVNHAEGGVTKVYQHYAHDREKRAALAKLEARLLTILDGREPDAADDDNVVRLG